MNLQTACNLTEGKSFGGRRTFANEKSILMATLVRLIGSLKANLDRKMIAKAVSDYGSLKEEFKDSLFGILESYQRGEIATDVLESMWRSEIKVGWEKAYGLGVRSVGNPFGIWEQDKSWLKGAEAEEYGYLGSFVNDITKMQLTMSVEDRLSMYVETLDGVYHHGMVDGSPEFVKITWILKEAKHCDDCIKFAAGSPYTKKTLPAVPRDGTSRCLSHCRCELRFEYADKKPAPENYVILGPKPAPIPAGYRLPSANESDRLGAMYAEIERLRGLIQATSGEAKRGFIVARRDVNAAMIDFMEKHKIYWVPGGNVQRTKMVESIADDVKRILLLEGGPGSGHYGHKGRPGKRGGSLPGGASASGHAASVAVHGDPFNTERVLRVLRMVPEKHLMQSTLKKITILETRKDVTAEFEKRGGTVSKGKMVDGFYQYNSGEMIVSRSVPTSTILHEFAHSLEGMDDKVRGMIWRANASTGKITRYGSTSPLEAWADGYAMYVTQRPAMWKKSKEIYDIFKQVFK